MTHHLAVSSVNWPPVRSEQIPSGKCRLKSLQVLFLNSTKVTDPGLEHLKGLTSLRELYLNSTKVTDAGLEHLKGLTALKELYLAGTQVTDAGVQRLQQALPNCKIYH